MTLAVLTTVFLVLFPRRYMPVDAGLALVALLALGWNAGYTRREIWSRFPPRGEGRRQAWTLTMAATGVLVASNAALGAYLARDLGGWDEVAARFANARLLLVVGVYFLWALVQQTLFQFYLLGRLRVLLPGPAAVVLTGIGYALVHLPDPWITAVTVVTGIFWTLVYDRYRALLPLALSHAVLGATFYYWVYGKDLAAIWFGNSLDGDRVPLGGFKGGG